MKTTVKLMKNDAIAYVQRLDRHRQCIPETLIIVIIRISHANLIKHRQILYRQSISWILRGDRQGFHMQWTIPLCEGLRKRIPE